MAETGGKRLVRAGVSVYAKVTIRSMKQQRSTTDDNVKKGHGSTNDTKHGSNNDGKKLRTYRPLRATVHTYFKAGANGTMKTETKNIHGIVHVNT